MTAPVATYRRIERRWDAIQYDGLNGADVIAFAGGSNYAHEENTPEGGLKIVLSMSGTDLQSQKVDLLPTMWLMIPLRARQTFNVVSEAEFGSIWELDPQGPHMVGPV